MLLALALATAIATPAPRTTFDSGIAQVREYGNTRGRALIFIPGLACGPWVWDRQIAALSATYRVYVITLPGFDGRPMIAGGNLMRRAVDAVHGIIHSRHLQRATVIGHSLGGTIAVMFGENYPDDAANIVTVEGGYPVAATQALRDRAVARSVAPYRDTPKREIGAALRKNMLQYTITRTADVDRATLLASRSDPKAIVSWMQAALSLDLTQGLSKIRVPITAIVPYDANIDPYAGFSTEAAKQRAYDAWIAHAPAGHAVFITPGRHFVMIDRPRAFESDLERAISRSGS